jgi:predicted TIM-barrel fold metal-dependent hydrolase
MGTTRRNTLALLGASLLAPSAGAQEAEAKWSGGMGPPRTPLPAGAADCHFHIYDSRFALAAGITTRTPDATAADYLTLKRRLGLSRHVVIQPSAYGFDNSGLLETMAALGPGARGVAVVDDRVADAELRRLDAAGVRGVRFNFLPRGSTTPEMMPGLSRRFAGLGWHAQVHAAPDHLVAMGDMLSGLACPVVFDHMGRVPQPEGTAHPVFALMRRLLAGGRAWVKLSAAYIDSKLGPPGYADAAAVARALIAEAPERMVWGSAWPHYEPPATRPDDAHMLDLLAEWTPDAATHRGILVDNPARLYGMA